MDLKTQITKIHYDKSCKGFLYNILGIGASFYTLIVKLRNTLYDKEMLKSYSVDAQVISVGNLTTGGVGKTPVVAGIAKYLVEQGEKVCIISRGYGGRLSNKNVNVISDGVNLFYKAQDAGDEPYWLAVNLDGCAVLTCKDRVKAANYAIKELGITKIILDDGFQYRRLRRDTNILLIDSEKQFGNNKLLPQGPLREGREGMSRVDKILVVSKNINHSSAENYAKNLEKEFDKPVFLCKAEPEYIYNIKTGEHLNKNSEIVAMSAIGQPEQFYSFLYDDYKVIEKRTFDDHHSYELGDLEGVMDKNIVVTEKDAVKLAKFDLDNIYALKLKTQFDVEKVLQI